VSENTKRRIAGVVGAVGLVILLVAFYIFFWPLITSKSFFAALAAMPESQKFTFAFAAAIGITMAALGLGTYTRSGKQSMKKGIADFANSVLNSKGKVSLRQIADYSKWNIESALGLKALEDTIKEMIGAGYFEDARFENGWLVRDVAPCPYCSEPVKITDKKCPNCGATIKR